MTAARSWSFLVAAVTVAAVTAATYDQTTGQILYFALYGTTCALTWWAALRLAEGPGRRPWLLIALAQTLWLTGDVIEMAYFLFTPEVPSVGISDAFWLGGYPLVAVALILMARRRAPGRLRGAVLDALTLSTVAVLAAWQFLIEPSLKYGLGDAIIPALYPVCDIVVLAAALFLALSPGERGAPTRLLLAAVGAYLTVDLGYNVLPHVFERWSLDLWYVLERLGVGLLAGHALLVTAVLHPGRDELTRPGTDVRTLHPARVVFLGLALLGTPTLALRYAGFSGEEIVTIIASAAAAAFVLTRFTTAVREQERMQAQLAYQARHDPLTGLANRTVLHDTLECVLRDGGAGTAVLYLDLDGFKQVNDTYGHEAGDAVLRTVGERLTAAIRGTDLAARLGGDEFVLLCRETTHQDAARLAERVLEEVSAPVPFGAHRLHVGVSIGVAVHEGDTGVSATGLLRAADAAMYSAKQRGKGRWAEAGAAGPLAA
ncbi:diguanylate cyclase domain-containing protein [Planomonospora corallina]|uniref:Diguanylate cyclase domain-containing protein n=1 Tax=Planomonospora corallina TaxID=1806052 RepID=A0ABV8IA23_9ACTN